MNIRTVLAIALGIAAAWKLLPEGHIKRPPLALGREVSAIQNHDFGPLFDAEAPLASLAHEGVYTVVEVYINTCATCKQIEAELPAFLEQRNDVVVRRVHFPEEGMSWSLDQAMTMESRLDAYQICGTPHVEIYDAQRRPVKQDRCGAKDGLHYLRQWMALETHRT